MRRWMWAAALLAAVPAVAEEPLVQVFASETCGCCDLWVEHMAAAGFRLRVETVPDLDTLYGMKDLAGVPPAAASCHTAIVDGYLVEGHVPAAEVRRLLAERPDAAGIAVPGMPQGSPGMPAAVAERYDVIVFGGGATERFATYVGEQRVD